MSHRETGVEMMVVVVVVVVRMREASHALLLWTDETFFAGRNGARWRRWDLEGSHWLRRAVERVASLRQRQAAIRHRSGSAIPTIY